MNWEQIERWGNRAQLPLTVGGYFGWAYALWPKGAVVFGHPSDVNWQAFFAALIVLVGVVSTAPHIMVRLGKAKREPELSEQRQISLPESRSNVIDQTADEDAGQITQRINFEQPYKVEGPPQLTAVDPFIEFSVGIRNSSVLTLEVEREVEGRMRIDQNQELRQALEIQKYPVPAIRHGDYQPIVFRQWLSTEAAAKIRHQRTTIFDAGRLAIYFTFVHRDKRSRQRIALGNQLSWDNPSPEGWQPLTANEHRAVNRIAQLVSRKPQSILVAWDRGAEQFAFDLYSALCGGGWNARVEPYTRGLPEAQDGSIEVYGKDRDGIAHELSRFFTVVFGEYVRAVGSSLTLPANAKDDIQIVIGSK